MDVNPVGKEWMGRTKPPRRRKNESLTPQGRRRPNGPARKKHSDGSFSFPKSMSAEDSATRNLNTTPKKPRYFGKTPMIPKGQRRMVGLRPMTPRKAR